MTKWAEPVRLRARCDQFSQLRPETFVRQMQCVQRSSIRRQNRRQRVARLEHRFRIPAAGPHPALDDVQLHDGSYRLTRGSCVSVAKRFLPTRGANVLSPACTTNADLCAMSPLLTT